MSLKDEIQINALEFFKKIEETERLKGTYIITKCCACVLLASQSTKIPKNIKDITRQSGI